MIAFSLRTFCCRRCSSLSISVDGKTYKSAIKRPIKMRTHNVRKHTHRLANGRQAVRVDRQLDERTDGQIQLVGWLLRA